MRWLSLVVRDSMLAVFVAVIVGQALVLSVVAHENGLMKLAFRALFP